MNRVTQHMRAICDKVFDLAQSFNAHICVVAVDLGGHPVVLMRGDHAQFATIEAARRKAVAASTLQMPTAAAVDLFKADPLVTTALTASGEMLLIPGGFPVIFEGNCVGGFGIAGGHYSEDDMIGRKALESMRPVRGGAPS